MKRLSPLLVAALLLLAGCKHNDDFAFSGTVVDVEYCTSSSDCGYAIQMDAPDTLGGTYHTADGKEYNNVVVAFGNDRIIYMDSKISGRMYIDNGYSKAYCYYHYRDTRGNVPEAIFTEIQVEED